MELRGRGPTDDPEVLALRRRQVRNFLTTLALSLGVPMLLGGDEIGRTQHGNNNAYCQDNEISWYDWDNVDTDLLAWARPYPPPPGPSGLPTPAVLPGRPVRQVDASPGGPRSAGSAPTGV